MAILFGHTATRAKTPPMQGDPLILFRPTLPSLGTEIFMWVMAMVPTICCDSLPTENFLEKSGGQATVTANSTLHTASSWIHAAGIQSWWWQIVATGACRFFLWTAHIFAPLETSRGSACHVTFIPKASGWSVRTSTARFAFSTATTRWLCNWEMAAPRTGKLAHAVGNRVTNSLLGSSSRPTRLFFFTTATF